MSGADPIVAVIIPALDEEDAIVGVLGDIPDELSATVIVVDNIARHGRVLDPAPSDAQAHAVRDMIEMMGAHPRLDTAAIQTVGTKGWDGFAVALVD